MKFRYLAVILLSALAGCGTFQKNAPLPMADQVDLDQFMGRWYVIAAVPGIVYREPYNFTLDFARAQRGIHINFKFNSGDPAGDEKAYSWRAMIDNPGINTDWQVVDPIIDRQDLKVLYVEPDYSATVLGHPNRKDIWILSRRPTMAAPLYSDLILELQRLGYDVSRIRRVPQN